ncbi:hypothetical protein FRC10_004955 [Ceratobasidium sp. 414]|nr:hypothetical protein FRC10_004955 [Ceratobasidium sp. 414]
MTVLGSIKTALLGASPESKAERQLLAKIDTFVLSFLCLVYWSNYLNRSNLQFAYVSGMKEAVGLVGNDYTVATTVFTVGFVSMKPLPNLYCWANPAQFCDPVLTSKILVPADGVYMGLPELCALGRRDTRAVVHGPILASTRRKYSPAHTGCLGPGTKTRNWANVLPCLPALRKLAHFSQGSCKATYISEILMTLPHTTSDGVIAIMIALYGVLVFPDTPKTTKAFYLTIEDRELAKSRIPPRPKAKFDKTTVKNIFMGWRYWMFSLLFVVTSQLEAYGTNGIVSIWLTRAGIVGPPRNSYYALGLIAVAIFTTILAGLATDIWGKRWRVNIFMGVALLISSIMLLVWEIPLGAKYFAFYLGGCGYAGQGSNFAWANEISRTDLERSFILYSMNLWSNAFTAWWIILIWPVSSAPRYRHGMISTIPISIISILIGWVLQVLHKRSTRGNKAGRSNKILRDQGERGEAHSDTGHEPNEEKKTEIN